MFYQHSQTFSNQDSRSNCQFLGYKGDKEKYEMAHWKQSSKLRNLVSLKKQILRRIKRWNSDEAYKLKEIPKTYQLITVYGSYLDSDVNKFLMWILTEYLLISIENFLLIGEGVKVVLW